MQRQEIWLCNSLFYANTFYQQYPANARSTRIFPKRHVERIASSRVVGNRNFEDLFFGVKIVAKDAQGRFAGGCAENFGNVGG